uniref:Uncharacterized protein n=1 Tax=Oryzias latipes TaxID=8090 RepID=A0A3B3IDJ8_ORYLA
MDSEESYGGCERPDAMISSDSHEFIVKREDASTSGTIKSISIVLPSTKHSTCLGFVTSYFVF